MTPMPTQIAFHRVLSMRLSLPDCGKAIATSVGDNTLAPHAWQKRACGAVAAPHWEQYCANTGANESLRIGPSLYGNSEKWCQHFARGLVVDVFLPARLGDRNGVRRVLMRPPTLATAFPSTSGRSGK
jgi:hypothetical protein